MSTAAKHVKSVKYHAVNCLAICVLLSNDIFELVAIDCIGPLPPTTKGNRSIIVAIDTFSRFVETRCEEEVTAIKFAKFLVTNVITRYGSPQQILTDNAQTFGAEVSKEICNLFGIKHLKSTPLHSQGDAIVERVNATIGDKLSMLVNGNDQFNMDNWDDALPFITNAINITVHTSTGVTPVELMFGRDPKLANDMVAKQDMTVHQLYSKLAKMQLEENIAKATNNNLQSKVTSKKRYNTNRKDVQFNVGNQVWVLKKLARSAKLANNSEGPYNITAIKANNVYDMEHTNSSKKLTRHVSTLRQVVARNTIQTTQLIDKATHRMPIARMTIKVITTPQALAVTTVQSLRLFPNRHQQLRPP